MNERVLIVGQGLAGTALGLELEAAGIPFVIASEGHARAASMVAAGLVNPVVGQRFAKAWRVAEQLPFAEAWYRNLETRWGVRLWHPLRLRRLFASAVEKDRADRKHARGELEPYATPCAGGLEIHEAAWVDLPELLGRAAQHWRESGVLSEIAVVKSDLCADAGGVEWGSERFSAAILCTGAGALGREWFRELSFEVARGEILQVNGAKLGPNEAVSRGTWVLPDGRSGARIGATYDRSSENLEPTELARRQLLAAAKELVDGELTVIGQRVGLRITLPDRAPVMGWRMGTRMGIFGGLGSRGTLSAPWLARLWRQTLEGAIEMCPAEVDNGRFSGK